MVKNNVKFFTEADCDMRDCAAHVMNTPPTSISLAKANRLLEERGKVVYGHVKDGVPNYWGPHENNTFEDTHAALLICVEEIEKDTAESILKAFANWGTDKPGPLSLNDIQDRARKLIKQGCAHKNTEIWEPHLAGARRCLDCKMVYNPNCTPAWSHDN